MKPRLVVFPLLVAAACGTSSSSESTFPPATNRAPPGDPTCTGGATFGGGESCSVEGASCRPEGECASALRCTCDGRVWSCQHVPCTSCPWSSITEGVSCSAYAQGLECPRNRDGLEPQRCTCDGDVWRCASEDAGADANTDADAGDAADASVSD